MVYVTPSRAKLWLLWSLALVLPATALQLPNDAVTEPIHPGAYRFELIRPDGPYAIYGIVWDRTQPDLTLRTTIGRDYVRGLEPTSSQVSRLNTAEQTVVAAVNGDFYVMAGHNAGYTIGLCVRNGELVGLSPGRPAFMVTDDGDYRIAPVSAVVRLAGDNYEAQFDRLNDSRAGNQLVLYTPAWAPTTVTDETGVEVAARWVEPGGRLETDTDAEIEITAAPVRGAGNMPIPADGVVLSGSGQKGEALAQLTVGQRLRIQVAMDPALKVREAIGGSDVLNAGGEVVFGFREGEPRHPRTIIGWDDEQAVALIVDGRRAGHSIGMTMHELALLLDSFGCTDGVNLDGGGSSTAYFRGEIRNRPSDGRERSVANSLALVSLAGIGPAAALTVEPTGPWRLAVGTQLPLRVTAKDARLNPLPNIAIDSVEFAQPIAQMAGDTLVAGVLPGRTRVTVRAGGLERVIDLEVVDRVAQLRAEPESLVLRPGAPAEIRLAGVDARGEAVAVDPAMLRWSFPAGVLVQRDGRYVGDQPGTRGVVTIEGLGTRVEVPVRVAGPQMVEDFNGDFRPTFAGSPETVEGSATTVVTVGGAGHGRLDYRLGEGGTRAAYLRLDRQIDGALALRAKIRGQGQQVWVRVQLIDGNGTPQYLDLFRGELPATWRDVELVLDPGFKAPLTWHSVYVVTTNGGLATVGQVDFDDLVAVR